MAENGYPDTERRKDWSPCPLHESFEKQIEKNLLAGEKRMERFEEKIDDLLKGQARQALAIQIMQDTLTNGLSGEIRRTMECTVELTGKLDSVCKKYDAKFKESDDLFKKLADFDWFRKWANRTKDGVIGKLLSVIFLGGLAAGVIIVLVWLAKHVGLVKVGL